MWRISIFFFSLVFFFSFLPLTCQQSIVPAAPSNQSVPRSEEESDSSSVDNDQERSSTNSIRLRAQNPLKDRPVDWMIPASTATPLLSLTSPFLDTERSMDHKQRPTNTEVEPSIAREDDEEGGEEEKAFLTAAIVKTFGRVKQFDIAKEVYLSMMARQHPFPFCAWQIFTPVLLDTNSIYRLQALHFRTRNDVYRITGHFPRVRYFSFQSYDSMGQPLSTLPDFSVRERQGGNPFTNPCLSPSNETGTFEIYVTADGQHGYPNELAGLRDPSLVVSTTTILYRLYGTDPTRTRISSKSKDVGDPLWGFVDPPTVEKRIKGKQTWEKLPPCDQFDIVRVADEFVAAERKYLFPLPPQDDVCGLYNKAGRDGVVPSMYPFGHLETRGVRNYVVYTNKDSNYLYWCDSINRLGPNFILVLRGKLPSTPSGLYDEPRVAKVQGYEARYVSISTVENMAPSDTYQSVYDKELEVHYGPAWDRHYTIVAAANQSLVSICHASIIKGQEQPYFFLPFSRQGLTPPRLPGLIYREILSRYRVNGEPDCSAAYLKSVCDASNQDCSQAITLEKLSAQVMGEYYPNIEVYTCNPSSAEAVKLN